MRSPLPFTLALAVVVIGLSSARAADAVPASRTPAVAAPGPSGRIPTDAGPTAARLENLAADPSYDSYRRGFDGEGLSAGSAASYTLKNPIGPQMGTGAPPAGPRPSVGRTKDVAAPSGKEGFWDDATVGFAAMGALAGGLLGFAAFGLLGMFAPFLGVVIGAALLVAVFKAKGYKKADAKAE